MVLTEMFYTFLITATSGLIIAIITACYKSKCRKINICGIIIERDIVLEELIDLEEIKHKVENNI